jgi:hypothetical protein
MLKSTRLILADKDSKSLFSTSRIRQDATAANFLTFANGISGLAAVPHQRIFLERTLVLA